MTDADDAKVRGLFQENLGMCVTCRRHFKSSSGWAAHIRALHPGVWREMGGAP